MKGGDAVWMSKYCFSPEGGKEFHSFKWLGHAAVKQVTLAGHLSSVPLLSMKRIRRVGRVFIFGNGQIIFW